jgi:TfoX/Sxy family transcriptional regulator of competence genes
MEGGMSYNTKLEEKIDAIAKQWRNVDKKKMFGGICYLLKGNMAFGIWKNSLIVRMEKGLAEKSLKVGNVKPFDITGRPMAGWIMAQEPAWKNAASLAKWIEVGKRFALSLPEKKGKGKVKKTKTLKEYKP